MAHDPLLQVDFSFAYDPLNLQQLSSAQLTILASSLHSEPVNPFDAAEARKLFAARRGSALAAEAVKREEIGPTSTGLRRRSIVRLGPEWGVFATNDRPELVPQSSQPPRSVARSRPSSPIRRTDRPAHSPPRQLALVDLTSFSDGDDDDEEETRPHRHRHRHRHRCHPSRSPSPAHRSSRRPSRSRDRSPSPTPRSHLSEAAPGKRSRSPAPSSHGPPPEDLDSTRASIRRRMEAGLPERPAGRILHERDWNWQSMKDELDFLSFVVKKCGDTIQLRSLCPKFPESDDLLFLPASMPNLDHLPTADGRKMPQDSDIKSKQASAKLRVQCQVDTLNYLFASLPQYNPNGLVATRDHVAALRLVPNDPHHPLQPFRQYWSGLAEVRRCWARLRNDKGGAGGSLWRVVTGRLHKQGGQPPAAGDARATLMGVMDQGLAEPQKREGFVQDWKAKRLL